MTVRDAINSRVRKVMVVIWAGGLLFVSGMASRAFGFGHQGVIAGLVGLGVLLLGSVVAQSGFLRCPVCRGNIAPLAMRGFGLNRKVRFCPFCGVDVDTDPAAGPVESSQDW
jgi:hypothetical protein